MSDDDSSNNNVGRTLSGQPVEPLPPTWAQSSSGPRIGRIGDAPSSAGVGRSGNSRFATISGMNQGSGGPSSPGSDNEDEDEDKPPQSWFAGGERSGISVQNPDSRRAVPGGDMVRELLRRAAEAGPAPGADAVSSGNRLGAFTGGGHVLGSDDVPSSYVPDPDAQDEDSLEPAIRQITFWRDGFTVEDGELMRYDDPNNSQIIAEINAGRAPPSILDVRPGQPVELRVAKRTDEDYVPPKGTKVFAGSGHRLGAPVPDVGLSTRSGSTMMPGSFPAAGSTITVSAPREVDVIPQFEVDQSQPTTSIQVRLADGTRMVSRMNLTHTVRDIRNFINASRPENLRRPYTISTSFPNRVLEDDTATIQVAGLVNSVVIQRWA